MSIPGPISKYRRPSVITKHRSASTANEPITVASIAVATRAVSGTRSSGMFSARTDRRKVSKERTAQNAVRSNIIHACVPNRRKMTYGSPCAATLSTAPNSSAVPKTENAGRSTSQPRPSFVPATPLTMTRTPSRGSRLPDRHASPISAARPAGR